MADPLSDPSVRRDVIQKSMQDHVGGAAVDQAVQVSTDEFPLNQPFSVTKFLDRVSELNPEVKAARLRIFKDMLQFKMKADAGSVMSSGPASSPPSASHAAAPAPARAMSHTPSVASIPPGFHSVFDVMATRLMQSLAARNPSYLTALSIQLGKELRSLDISSTAEQIISAWAGDLRGQVNSYGMSKNDIAEVLHSIYVWCCETLGPVDTDRVFGQIMREADQLPEAVQFPPRSLL